MGADLDAKARGAAPATGALSERAATALNEICSLLPEGPNRDRDVGSCWIILQGIRHFESGGDYYDPPYDALKKLVDLQSGSTDTKRFTELVIQVTNLLGESLRKRTENLPVEKPAVAIQLTEFSLSNRPAGSAEPRSEETIQTLSINPLLNLLELREVSGFVGGKINRKMHDLQEAALGVENRYSPNAQDCVIVIG